MKRWGYTHIDKDFVNENGLDIKELTKGFDVRVGEGTFSYYLIGDKSTGLEFSQRPDKKQMKQLIKESKKKHG